MTWPLTSRCQHATLSSVRSFIVVFRSAKARSFRGAKGDYRTVIPRTILTLSCLLLLSGSALAHPRHASIAEAEWNAKTGRLEIALQVNPVDLEQALRRIADRPVDLDRSAGIDRLMQKYLRRSFIAKEADGKPAKLVWVGHEVDLKNAWLYFEVPLKKGPENVTFGVAFFLELLPDQTNTINFRVGKLRKSLTFTAEQLESVFRASQ